MLARTFSLLGTIHGFINFDVNTLLLIIHGIAPSDQKEKEPVKESLIYLVGSMAVRGREQLAENDHICLEGIIEPTESGPLYDASKYTYF